MTTPREIAAALVARHVGFHPRSHLLAEAVCQELEKRDATIKSLQDALQRHPDKTGPVPDKVDSILADLLGSSG